MVVFISEQTQGSLFYTGGNIARAVSCSAEAAYPFFYDPDDGLWHPVRDAG